MENINIYPDQDIKIMGARSQPNFKNGYISLSAERNLVALDSTTKTPVTVFWIYEGDSTGVHSSSFRDTKPFKSLLTLKPAVRLRGSNISTGRPNSFTAVMNDGSACDFDSNDQEVSYSQPERNHDIHTVGNFSSCPALINKQGQILSEVELPENIAALNDVIDVTSGYCESIILRGNGSLIYWQHNEKTNVGPPPTEIAELNDIIAIQHNGFSVAVLRSGGQVMAWGRPKSIINYGSEVPQDIAALTDIVKLWSATHSYIAQRRNGQLVAWGDGTNSFGVGDLPPAIAKLTDIIHVATASTGAAALRANGQVVGWGDYGKNTLPQDRPWTVVPYEIARLRDILDVQALGGPGFAALRRNGTVVTWGVTNNSKVPSDLTDVVAITGSHDSIAALKKDGTVTVFGHPAMVSSWQTVRHLLVDVQAVYSSFDSFIALTASGKVISWSFNKQFIPEALQGKVSYQQ